MALILGVCSLVSRAAPQSEGPSVEGGDAAPLLHCCIQLRAPQHKETVNPQQ